MFGTVTIPVWLFVLILLFAAVTLASHFLFPSVRWFFRKRMERVVARINTRLQRPIEPFKLARRHDMIQRLIYDPEVTREIVAYAREHDVPENVGFEKARDYAREIVPSFSATAYFSIGMRFARWLSTSLYHVRLGDFEQAALDRIDDRAAVVFVMNHRSNMDYVLVTHLVSRASAMSYAVGEWARVWPLSSIIRAMGAYFIRRRNRGGLYRRVLARYVQMATVGGVTQAFFPEGGLSLTGRIAAPKLGILSYVAGDTAELGRDVIFVPVAVNYDRVLEDKFLVAADKSGVRRFRPPIWTILSDLGRHLFRRVTWRFRKFGTASVGFGTPLSLAAWHAQTGDGTVEALAAELMGRVGAVVPVLPVPLVARALIGGAADRAAVQVAVAAMLDTLAGTGAPLPRRDAATVTQDALALLAMRKLVVEEAGGISVAQGAGDLIAFYAASIAHHFDDASAPRARKLKGRAQH